MIIRTFGGEIPKLDPRVLPDNMAQHAYNCRLEDGRLVPLRLPFKTAAVAANTQTIYQHANEWLAWDTPVHAAPGPVADDRLYYTGDGAPKMRVAGTVYPLALPAPSAAPAVALTGTATSSNITSRVYVITYVTQFDEESGPSPATSVLDWKPGQTVNFSAFPAAPAGRGINRIRIYRSMVSDSTAQYYFVDEISSGATSYNDSKLDYQLNEALPTLGWKPPPDGLQGLVAMPGGFMAGYVGRRVYFSEPWHPHAWPEKYSIALDYPVVALGVTDSTLVVGTTGKPYSLDGSAPDNIDPRLHNMALPCTNAKTMVTVGNYVIYASLDGLVAVSPGGAPSVITSGNLIAREAWKQYLPASLVAGRYGERYIMSYEKKDKRGNNQTGTLLLDLSGEQPFITRTDTRASAYYQNTETGRLYYVLDAAIHEFDSPLSVRGMLNWRSKLFTGQSVTYGACMVEPSAGEQTADEVAAIAAQEEANAAYNASIFATGITGYSGGTVLNVIMVNGDDMLRENVDVPTIALRLFGDGKLLATVTEYGRVVRLPAIQRARAWEIDIACNVDISEIRIGTSAQEVGGHA